MSFGYFELCRAVGMFVGWYCLVGYLPAFPLTFLAVRAQNKRQRLRAVAWTLLGFAAFFGSCHGLLLWKAAPGT